MRCFRLDEYNKYVNRNLKPQIKNIDKIFSTVSILDNDKRTEIVDPLVVVSIMFLKREVSGD
jgi:hypothetical protein